MATHYLMERGPDRMNVPGYKLQEYLEAGWVEIDRYQVNDAQPDPPKEKKTVPELKEIAKDLGIEGYSSMNKDALLAAIEEAEAEAVGSDDGAESEQSSPPEP